jgi:hypothetical protein
MGGLENKRLDSSRSDGSLQPGIVEPGIVEVALDRNERMSNGVSIIRTRLLGDNSCSCVSYLDFVLRLLVTFRTQGLYVPAVL